MHGSLIIQGVEGSQHRGTPMASVSLPDLAADVISIAIVIFLWLQSRDVEAIQQPFHQGGSAATGGK